MKKISLIALALITGITTYAQTTIKSTPAKIGVKGGLNLPAYKLINNGNTTDTKTTTNFHLTGFVDLSIKNNFYFQPGLSLQGKGATFVDNANFTITQNTLGLEVPLNFLGKINAGPGKLFIGAGPYVAANIAGKNKAANNNGDKTTSDLTFGNASTDDLKTIDLGLNFLGGYEFNTGFTIGGGYGYGFSNLRPEGNSDNKTANRVWSFSLGYIY